jgi:putative glycosyltransferase (TIGR04348 family)
MKISLVMPAGVAPRSGNQHTAGRWAKFLRSLGHRVAIVQQWDGAAVDLLIALHARKSSPSIESFHRAHPDRPLIVVLTGTDLYRDIGTHPEARKSLQFASRLVVLQPAGLRELPKRLRAKTRVIFQSSDTRVRHCPPRSRFRVAVVGHLRQEKDPFRAVIALAHLPQRSGIEVMQMGDALTPDMAGIARRWMRREPRYRWLGSKPHADALRRLAASHLLVVSSVMEGGANVICEASRIGVPILASRVPGNLGMLGGGYAGYFPLFDDRRLGNLMARAATDADFYRRLKRAVAGRRTLFAPLAERRALRDLLIDACGGE